MANAFVREMSVGQDQMPVGTIKHVRVTARKREKKLRHLLFRISAIGEKSAANFSLSHPFSWFCDWRANC